MISAVVRFGARVRDAWLVRWWQLASRVVLDARGVQRAADLRCYGLPIITRTEGSHIALGEGVVLCSHSRFTALGVAKPVILRTLRAGAAIDVGANSGLSGTVICSAVSVSIGRECLFGADVQISDTDFHPVAPEGRRFENRPERIAAAPVVIEDNVFLGAGTRVLKGVRIGRNSVVGAGSVVVSDIPPDSVAAGVPARVLGDVNAMTQRETNMSAVAVRRSAVDV